MTVERAVRALPGLPGHDHLPAAGSPRRRLDGAEVKAIVVITDSEAIKAFERTGVRDQTKLYLAPIDEVG